MEKPRRILVTRFSALGDVAMVVPVLTSLSEQHPELEILFVSQGFAQPLVAAIPRVTFFRADLKSRHKGIMGMWRLSRDLNKMGPWFAIADLHNVLRTKILRIFLYRPSVKVAIIEKGRKEKRQLTRRYNKKKVQLTHTINRYIKVFNGLKIELKVKFNKIAILPNPELLRHLEIEKKTDKYIGIAPFAKHKGKMYPLSLMEQVVDSLSALKGIKIFLFGGGKEEEIILAEWEKRFKNTSSLARKVKLNDELLVMSQLDLMISMDSANMHLASLAGVPVVSIWGATHPFAGFYGWNQSEQNYIQINNLECRPCSVFGNKPCFRKDYACLYHIEPNVIIHKVESLIGSNKG
jgi:ADP-heptose:LPS heptosyltransferase